MSPKEQTPSCPSPSCFPSVRKTETSPGTQVFFGRLIKSKATLKSSATSKQASWCVVEHGRGNPTQDTMQELAQVT